MSRFYIKSGKKSFSNSTFLNKGCVWHVTTMRIALWLRMTSSGCGCYNTALWPRVTSYGRAWSVMAERDALWLSETYYGIAWHATATYDALWPGVTQYRHAWHTAATCDILWSCVTRYHCAWRITAARDSLPLHGMHNGRTGRILAAQDPFKSQWPSPCLSNLIPARARAT